MTVVFADIGKGNPIVKPIFVEGLVCSSWRYRGERNVRDD